MNSIIILIFFSGIVCNAQKRYTYHPPKIIKAGWETTDLRYKQVDTTKIYQLFNQLQNGDSKIHSVLLIKDDQLIIEEYFGEHSMNKPHDLRSVTKSIRAILTGIAIDKGFIENVNDPISRYLLTPLPTQNLDERKKDITIKHLLTMSSGLDCNDWDRKSKGQEDKVYKKKDWIQYTLNLPMINDPGTISNYCSMGVMLLAEVISQSSGISIEQFAENYLFKPLHINNVYWGHTSNKHVVPSGKRLYMTSRDLAKIGQLTLNQGIWNGNQIVPKEWVQEIMTPKTKISGIEYGYLWWNIPFKVNGQVVQTKTATGNGGQYIIVVPETNMVVVFTGGAYNSEEDKLPFAIMRDIFLPTFMNTNSK